jgi:hypothetical protein
MTEAAPLVAFTVGGGPVWNSRLLRIGQLRQRA